MEKTSAACCGSSERGRGASSGLAGSVVRADVLKERQAMRLSSLISYGTQRYPEHVARRLRVFNATAWGGSLMVFGFALSDLFFPTLWRLAAINIVVASILAAIPLMHRFGELAATLTYGLVSYTAIFVICLMLGTDSGMQLQYLAIAAGAVLVVGPDRIFLIAVFAVTGIALIIALELLAPGDTGLLTPSLMIWNFIGCVIATSAILIAIVFYAVRQTSRAEAAAQKEYRRSEALLANILPIPVAERLKSPHGIIADRYDDASILFADMAEFTARTNGMPPVKVLQFLNVVFTTFDQLVERHGLEKIKTTGDGYMVVGGVPIAHPNHLEITVHFALAMLRAAAAIVSEDGEPVPIRIGIACGPVVAGVVGTRKFFYDVWGDAVNVASRMESTGVPGRIQVTQDVYERLESRFDWESRGLIDVKGKGLMPTWFLLEQE
jgi:adenylate cyclase